MAANNKDVLIDSFDATDFKRFNRNDRRILKGLIVWGPSSNREVAIFTGIRREKVQQRILALRKRKLVIPATRKNVTYYRLSTRGLKK